MNRPLDFILYAQHGWADNHYGVAKLANSLASPNTEVITPNLGYWKTWWRINPLINQVEQNAIATINRYPNIPLRIIGHSMGGLIWLEVLDRHPQWWSKIHSLVLVASPIGGADLARMLDPLGIGLGIARDLAINRRKIAEKIAQTIPTLIIASDLDRGSDGTISVESTKFFHAKFTCLSEISHDNLRYHPSVIPIIQDFWANPTKESFSDQDFSNKLIEILRSIPGMTDGNRRYLARSQPYITFANGISIRLWKNPLQMTYIFLENSQGDCLYSGFVGWLHIRQLYQSLAKLDSF